MQDRENTSAEGEASSVSRLLAGALIHRGELAALELGEARAHAAVTAALTAIAGAFLILGGFAFTLAIAASVWARDDRALIITGVALAYACAAGLLAWAAYRRTRTWTPFAETRRVLHGDCAAVRELVGRKGP